MHQTADTISIAQDPTCAAPTEGEFSGWGSVSYLEVNLERKGRLAPKAMPSRRRGLGVWAATAIAANDLVGSILYTVGVTTAVSGKLAPLALLLVCVTLFFPFRGLIQDVCRRVPLNGGVYSCVLLLVASKSLAAVAACFSLVDLICTAVVSAASASAYFYFEFQVLDLYWTPICLLALFGLLTMLGVRDSSHVSLGILMIHMSTMLLVVVAAVYQFSKIGISVASENFKSPSISSNGWMMDLFLGYCVGVLGATGFETSSNYIEEQGENVFPTTLRNMCYLVLAYNPVISLLALCILPISTIVANSTTVISVMADASFGKWLRVLVAIDAVIVLCGGVLTAFIAVGGLMERMSRDNLLPSSLLFHPLTKNEKTLNDDPPARVEETKGKRSRSISIVGSIVSTTSKTEVPATLYDADCKQLEDPNSLLSIPVQMPESNMLPACDSQIIPIAERTSTPPMIPLLFFILCTVLFIIFKGDVSQLSLVFSMAFLSVLGMFAVCSLILRVRSDRESNHVHTNEKKKRDVGGLGVLLAFVVVALAMVGNAINNPSMIRMFAFFFLGLWIIVSAVSMRAQILRVLVFLLFGSVAVKDGHETLLNEEKTDGSRIFGSLNCKNLFKWVKQSRDKPVAYFTNGESLYHLNQLILYVLKNEPTKRLIVVHCFQDHKFIPRSLEANCRILDHVYPDLRLDLVFVKCEFNDSVIPMIANKLGVQSNLCLVSRPWNNTKHVGDVKGVRVVLLRE